MKNKENTYFSNEEILNFQKKLNKTKNFDEQIKDCIEILFDDYIFDLSSIIRYKSVSSAQDSEHLNDKNCKLVLKKMLDICNSYGFFTKNIKDVVGYATWADNSTQPLDNGFFASLSHLDIVPAAEGWCTKDPFELTKQKDKYIARGVLDDKGPAMCVLYAVRVLQILNIRPKIPFRMIFGTNEECGSNEIPILKKYTKIPIFTFTPDSEYPLTYAEKGILNIRIDTTMKSKALSNLHGIDGDMHRNRVPAKIGIKISNKTYSANGVQAHVAWPFKGVNALVMAAHMIYEDKKDLEKIPNILPLIDYFKWIDKCFRWNNVGTNLGLEDFDFTTDPSSKVVVAPYKLAYSKDRISLYISIRYPYFISLDDIISKMFNKIKELKNSDEYLSAGDAIASSKYKIIKSGLPAVINVKNPYVCKLLDAYRHVTKDFSDPVESTGGSYAKHYPNTVAFGASFQNREHISAIAHNNNEFMYIDDMKKNIEIYAHAIYNLVCSNNI